MINTGELQLPSLDGHEVAPGIFLLGEPTAIPETDKMRCLANVHGALAVIELTLKFLTGQGEKCD